MMPLGSKKKRVRILFFIYDQYISYIVIFQQKFAIGDDNGSLSLYEYKTELQPVFQVTPNEGKEIARVELGGTDEEKDQIYVSSGQQIVGINKKGKVTNP